MKRFTSGWQCSRCRKVLPTSTAAETHLDRLHNGEGVIVYVHAQASPPSSTRSDK